MFDGGTHPQRNRRTSRSTVELIFQPALDDAASEGKTHKELRDGLSTVLQIGDTLWVANDESASVERLTLSGHSATEHVQFPLRDVLDLPVEGRRGDETPEIDIEGMAWDDGYLWIVGSHSSKRCKPDQDAVAGKAAKRLARVEPKANRFLLARVPLTLRDGRPIPVRKDKPRRAQRLPGDKRGNDLTRLLKKDRHLGKFIGLPGKENGFDVEGLAVAGERVYLGLRGPVLGGWAVVLELRVQGDGDSLRLMPVDDDKSACVRKHFLALGGLGVRDLCLQGDDLLILAGPTMALDGPVRVWRWPGAARLHEARVVEAEQLQHVLDVPFGTGCDHAEGLTLFQRNGMPRPAMLIVHDRPAPQRQRGRSGLLADIFELPG